MKKFLVTEEEKQRILGLYEDIKNDPTTRTTFSEQKSLIPSIKRTRKGNIGITKTTTGGEATISGDVKSSQSWGPQDKAEINGYLKDENSGWSKDLNNDIYSKIKWWDSDSKKNYKKLLNREPWVLFNVLDEIKYGESGSDPDANAAKAQRVVIIDKGKSKEVIPGNPGTPGETWKVTYDRQTNPADTSNFFANNSWAISDTFKNYVNDEIINPLKDIVTEAEARVGQRPQFYIEDFNIDSSVSRFRNTITNSGEPIAPGTENPDRMSFETLAEKRAQSALNYIKSQLISEGLIPQDGFTDSNIVINSKGGNGDGSSGPDPYVEGNKLVKSGKYKTLGDAFKDSSFTNPYGQYRYTKIKLKIGMIPLVDETKKPKTPPTPDKIVDKQNWEFKFFWKDTEYDFSFSLPKFSIKQKAKYPKKPKGLGWLKPNTEDCKVTWWERFLKKAFNYGKDNPATLGF